MAGDTTTLQVDTDDVTTVVVTSEVTNVTVSQDGDVTVLNASPATILAPTAAYRYVHTQSVASQTWTVDHNLGSKPGGVSVVSNADEIVYGDVTYTSANQLTVGFSAAFTGKVYIS